MSTVLMNATRQWSSRPADERYASLATMHAQAVANRNMAAHAKVPMKSLHVVADGDDVLLNGSTGTRAKLTHWAFGQLCGKAAAPASYLRELPAPLAADCLNNGLASIESSDNAAIMFARGDTTPAGGYGELTARAILSEQYTRIWNCDVTQRLVELEQRGPWQPAPAAFDGSRGLYLGDRDMFGFMVDNNRRIFETDKGGGLSRGFFCWNSEVGAASFGVMTFLYEYVCGNHRVWGTSDVREIRIRHVGAADQTAFHKLAVELRRYAESSAADDEAKVIAARNYQIAATKDEVLDTVFGLRIPQLSMKTIEAGYDLAEQRVDWYGSPRTAWGLAGGITEIARDLPNASERVALDRAATKIMEIAF